MSSDSGPDVLFLGFAERAAYVRDGNTNLFKWNVLGLKHIILSHIYPLSLSGWSLGFAFLSTEALGEHKFLLTDESGREAGVIIETRISNGYPFNNPLYYGACDPMEPLNS